LKYESLAITPVLLLVAKSAKFIPSGVVDVDAKFVVFAVERTSADDEDARDVPTNPNCEPVPKRLNVPELFLVKSCPLLESLLI
jgi:hypothetical protein